MTGKSSCRVLMVCSGNICRSPSAEGILRHMLDEAGLAGAVEVDSAGTSDWHEGEGPNPRAIKVAGARGYDLTALVSRPLRPDDYHQFDLMLAMDDGHLARLNADRPADARARVAFFLDAAPDVGRPDVPDPYYGDIRDYEYAIDLIEAGCRGWVARFKADL